MLAVYGGDVKPASKSIRNPAASAPVWRGTSPIARLHRPTHTAASPTYSPDSPAGMC